MDLRFVAAGAAMFGATAATLGQGADVAASEILGPAFYGGQNGFSSYAIGTTSCNLGDVNLLWRDNSNQHPVIAQNMYRLKNDRFEQIGQSWLKHGFCALQDPGPCGSCQPAGPGCFSELGPGCNDPYSPGLNGSQSGLGPKSDINPVTGDYSWPFTGRFQTGNRLFKRIQVPNADLDPSQNAGALYFGEGQYVSPDDAAAGNDDNNASWRRMVVGTFSNGGWTMGMTGPTNIGDPAIFAWKQVDDSVELQPVDVPGDGRFWIGSKVIDNGDGTWRYEFAAHNLNSHRAADGFSIPIASGVEITDIGFKDIDYHSGEIYDSTDWTVSNNGLELSWSAPQSFEQNPNGNALRWSTMYNFWFTANSGPEGGIASLSMFRPGGPESVGVRVAVPATVRPTQCNIADISAPFDVLNSADVTSFVNAFGAGSALADIAAPSGVLNSADVTSFVNAFQAGCP